MSLSAISSHTYFFLSKLYKTCISDSKNTMLTPICKSDDIICNNCHQVIYTYTMPINQYRKTLHTVSYNVHSTSYYKLRNSSTNMNFYLCKLCKKTNFTEFISPLTLKSTLVSNDILNHYFNSNYS